MMTIAEVKMRAAHADWLLAKQAWGAALTAINAAKLEWENAQAEFYGSKNAMSTAAGCGSCTGCSTGRGCQ
jgi:hypothetical protein